jgi:sigma54-dependent transcription regulator
VLTIELKGNDVAQKLDKFDRLQDVTGVVAIQAKKILKAGQEDKDVEVPLKKKALNNENLTPKLAEYTESMPHSDKERKSSRIR